MTLDEKAPQILAHGGQEALLMSLATKMEAIEEIMDASTKEELNLLMFFYQSLGSVDNWFFGCKKSRIGKNLSLFSLNSLLFASNKDKFFLDSLFFRFKEPIVNRP